jgi:hypothetical protein
VVGSSSKKHSCGQTSRPVDNCGVSKAAEPGTEMWNSTTKRCTTMSVRTVIAGSSPGGQRLGARGACSRRTRGPTGPSSRTGLLRASRPVPRPLCAQASGTSVTVHVPVLVVLTQAGTHLGRLEKTEGAQGSPVGLVLGDEALADRRVRDLLDGDIPGRPPSRPTRPPPAVEAPTGSCVSSGSYTNVTLRLGIGVLLPQSWAIWSPNARRAWAIAIEASSSGASASTSGGPVGPVTLRVPAGAFGTCPGQTCWLGLSRLRAGCLATLGARDLLSSARIGASPCSLSTC